MIPSIYNQGCDPLATPYDCDSITVEIHDCSQPSYPIIFEKKVMLHVDGTTSSLILPASLLNQTAYIAIKHCQALYTSSANCVTFQGSTVNYDFTTAASQAYGNNQKQIGPNEWGIYCGDFNQDCNIDILDLGIQEADINAFSFGCFCTDLNGDGNVDLLDATDLEGNVLNFIFCNNPF